MNRPMLRLFSLVLLLAVVSSALGVGPPQILIVVGPSDHPPGTHEVAAGGRVMEHCLEHMANLPGVDVQIVDQWPEDEALLDAIQSVVFIGDIFPPQRLPNTAMILAKLDQMMQRGCGIVCIHYATGLRGEDVAADGDHPLLRWLGGYFANRSCPHHESFARVFPRSTIEPAAPEHPVCRGWQTFSLHDEPYYNNYFGKDENQPARNVTVLANAMLPPDAPQQEAVAWCVEREDDGRGFAIVMPHFYKNWQNEDLRRFILNGIVWTAKLEVPANGVETSLPKLSTFGPQAGE